MKKRILVVEDGEEHRSDAEMFFRGLEDKVEVVYAKTFGEALSYTSLPGRSNEIKDRYRIDGAIVDLYMPDSSKSGAEPDMPQAMREDLDLATKPTEPRGVGIGALLKAQGTPFVFCTAGYHHGSRYEWIFFLSRAFEIPLIDGSSSRGEESDIKDWPRAYSSLEKLMK